VIFCFVFAAPFPFPYPFVKLPEESSCLFILFQIRISPTITGVSLSVFSVLFVLFGPYTPGPMNPVSDSDDEFSVAS
jgi:hypothetical protein